MFGALVALAVGGVAERVHGRFEHGPAQILRPLFGERAAAVVFPGLADHGPQAGVAGQLAGGREAVDVADLGRDRERQYPPDPGHREQQRDVAVLGTAGAQRASDRGYLTLEVVD